MVMEMTQKGLVHIYTGDGKGKTTAALGLALRAVGQGMTVHVVSFLKAMPTGEEAAVATFGDHLQLHRFCSIPKFFDTMTDEEKAKTKQQVEHSFAYAEQLAQSADMLILDEVFAAISLQLLTTEQVVELLNHKPPQLELVLTGRDAPPTVLALADYVSEMRCIAHPYTKNTPPRCGIEY